MLLPAPGPGAVALVVLDSGAAGGRLPLNRWEHVPPSSSAATSASAFVVFNSCERAPPASQLQQEWLLWLYLTSGSMHQPAAWLWRGQLLWQLLDSSLVTTACHSRAEGRVMFARGLCPAMPVVDLDNHKL